MKKPITLIGTSRRLSNGAIEQIQDAAKAGIVIQIHEDEARRIMTVAEGFEEFGGFADEFIAVLHVAHVEPAATKIFVEDLVPKLKIRRPFDANAESHGMPPNVPCSQSSPRRKCLRKDLISSTSHARPTTLKSSFLSQRITSSGSSSSRKSGLCVVTNTCRVSEAVRRRSTMCFER